jgi:hypothetical protein
VCHLFIDLKKEYDSIRREVLYDILIGFFYSNEIGKINKMCLNETYNKVRINKNLSKLFPIRNGMNQGDALAPLLFNFAWQQVIRRVQVNQDGLKLNGTNQLLVYADDVNTLGRSIMLERKRQILVGSKEIGLGKNVDTTKYMVTSREQNAG